MSNFIALLCEIYDQFDIDIDGLRYLTEIPIAESLDGNRFVTANCELTSIEDEGFPPNTYEFAFSISCVTFDGTELPFETQDRSIAVGYIPDEARQYIMPSVCAALNALIERVKPFAVYRVLKRWNLPEKALRKHDLITHALQAMSYTIDAQGTDSIGRPFFMMTRP